MHKTPFIQFIVKPNSIKLQRKSIGACLSCLFTNIVLMILNYKSIYHRFLKAMKVVLIFVRPISTFLNIIHMKEVVYLSHSLIWGNKCKVLCLQIFNAYKKWIPCLRLWTLIFPTKPWYFKFLFLSKKSTKSSHSIAVNVKIHYTCTLYKNIYYEVQLY